VIRYYQKGNNFIKKSANIAELKGIDNLIWVDLQNSPVEEIDSVEKFFNVDIPSRIQQEEIESSSRYIETDEYIVVNSRFLQLNNNTDYANVHISFVLKDDLLFTYREADLVTFAECVKRIKSNHKVFINGRIVFLVLFETRTDIDADMIETISRQISVLAKQVTQESGNQTKLLRDIANYQELALQLRENIIDKQRVISSLLKSNIFIDDEKERLRTILRDINSLVDHTNFLFERLEYLQNTFLGLINIDQNKTIKIFTVVSVVFMPPTLIASAYGMNFKILPELDWRFGYPFAIALMIVSSLSTLYVFKKKKWL
jgi:magnesium transporter